MSLCRYIHENSVQVLIGNKKDLELSRKVPKEEAKKSVLRFGMSGLFESSAKEFRNITEVLLVRKTIVIQSFFENIFVSGCKVIVPMSVKPLRYRTVTVYSCLILWYTVIYFFQILEM